MLQKLRGGPGRVKEEGPRRRAPERFPARASSSPCLSVVEQHAVGHLWLGILPRFARRKDLNSGVLVLGET